MWLRLNQQLFQTIPRLDFSDFARADQRQFASTYAQDIYSNAIANEEAIGNYFENGGAAILEIDETKRSRSVAIIEELCNFCQFK